MMKKLYLEPIGGLGNRMRSIASCLWAAEVTNSKLIIVWNQNSEFNSRIENHFLESDKFEIVSYKSKYKYLKNNIQKNLIKKAVIFLINKTLGFDFFMTDPHFKNQEQKILDLIRRNKKVYFKTYEEFGESFLHYSIFEPNFKLSFKINNFIGQHFNKNVIGIHIRRTDNEMSIINSPLESFIELLDQEKRNNPQVRFFLATDDKLVENKLIEKYGSSMIVRQKVLSRETVQGIEDAIIDLWCLSKTELIYGSYWSTFSIAATRIGNPKLIVVKR
ncbi:hypothetical protein M3O96_19135 [Aquiflexum sp. TKW24L]|uniref:hypothetical protein n=1 Tax=Aquiflexum sp. TKW24L TaxID=2942212 RepID=UPI0020BE7176|nr:hypothetical protein [Aquiflexum sp. TKW24L]MCL6261224.1 hypothetical protein [Aquiflexum sp. TKW24L]